MTRGLRENYILLLKIMALHCYHSIAQHHRCLARLLQTISGLRCLQSTDCVTKFNPWSFWRYFLLGKNRENSIWEFSHLYCLFSESVPWVTQRSYIWILHNNVFLHLFWSSSSKCLVLPAHRGTHLHLGCLTLCEHLLLLNIINIYYQTLFHILKICPPLDHHFGDVISFPWSGWKKVTHFTEFYWSPRLGDQGKGQQLDGKTQYIGRRGLEDISVQNLYYRDFPGQHWCPVLSTPSRF